MPTVKVLDALATKVRTLLADQSMHEHELAEHLGLTPAGLSKALHRRDGLRSRIKEIAEFLRVPPTDLMNGKRGKRPDVGPPAATDQKPRPEIVALQPGCHLVRLDRESIGAFGRGRWALIGPPIKRPVTGDLVAYLGSDGYRARTYTIDASNSHIVMTTSTVGATPEVYAVKQAPTMRVILALGERTKAEL